MPVRVVTGGRLPSAGQGPLHQILSGAANWIASPLQVFRAGWPSILPLQSQVHRGEWRVGFGDHLLRRGVQRRRPAGAGKCVLHLFCIPLWFMDRSHWWLLIWICHQVVDLVPGGSQIPVTNDNKLRYLNALAQHRLVNPVKEQVSAFIRGLNELVPDNLLSIFDENELEVRGFIQQSILSFFPSIFLFHSLNDQLLACGTSEYTISQLKSNHRVVGSSPEFHKVLTWFWIAISNFGGEELSRLLQFTTGSSQLPPGGLAELSPRFQIVASPSFGLLPTAHTWYILNRVSYWCKRRRISYGDAMLILVSLADRVPSFNQLCLPDYDTYESFEKALLLAIKEGSEGFGLVWARSAAPNSAAAAAAAAAASPDPPPPLPSLPRREITHLLTWWWLLS